MEGCAAHHAAARNFASSARAELGPALSACAVFGSVARGTARHDSDVDLLVVLNTDACGGSVNRADLRRRLEAGRVTSAPRLSLFLVEERELADANPVYLDMSDALLVLADVAGILPRFRARVADLIARQRSVRCVGGSGGVYWDLCPAFTPGRPCEPWQLGRMANGSLGAAQRKLTETRVSWRSGDTKAASSCASAVVATTCKSLLRHVAIDVPRPSDAPALVVEREQRLAQLPGFDPSFFHALIRRAQAPRDLTEAVALAEDALAHANDVARAQALLE